MVYSGYDNTSIALLFMIAIKLFQKIEFGSRRCLNRVEALKPSPKTKILQSIHESCIYSWHKPQTSVSVTKGICQSAGGIILQMP